MFKNNNIFKIRKGGWIFTFFICIFFIVGCGGDGSSVKSSMREPNSAPAISGAPSTSARLNEAYAFTPSASDINKDALSFSVSNKPSWASFDIATGKLSGTPDTATTVSNIVITVSDGVLSASLPAFSIYVAASPVISGVPPTSARLNEAYEFTPSAADANKDTLSFSISNKPLWANFDTTTGKLSGTPDTANTVSNIVITVNDGALSASLPAFSIYVAASPVISGVPTTSARLNEAYEFTPSAADANKDTLSFSISNKPLWANFDTTTGKLSGTPNTATTVSNIVITVNDGVLSTSLPTFSITITSLADTSDIDATSFQQGVTPFIAFLRLEGKNLTNVKSIKYLIAPKPNSVSKPVAVTYSIDALHKRGYIANTNNLITLPVFGLYAGYQNGVTVDIQFNDTSHQLIPFVIVTDIYVDPTQKYDRPVIIKKREADSVLGFDFFAIKSIIAGSPVIIDTDGEIRWIAASISNNGAMLFNNNAFIIGDALSTKFRHLELDGSISESYVFSKNYTNFHHNIDLGKFGFLAEFDAFENGVRNIESIIADVSRSGIVIKEWDFSKIISDYMTAAGDDPTLFVRPGIDWFHTNAATYDSRDNSIIVSSRENFVIKIDYETSKIIWILGDPTKYWYTFPSLRAKAVTLEAGGLYPIGQHATSITSDGLIMVFNNGGFSFNNPIGTSKGEQRNFSTVSAYQIDAQTLTAKEVWQFDYDESVYSDICSSAYEVNDKSILVSYAAANIRTKARLVGLNAGHDVIFDFEYDAGVCAVSWNAVPIHLEEMNIL